LKLIQHSKLINTKKQFLMNSITYNETIAALSNDWIEIPTLGRRSSFSVKVEKNEILIRNSSGKIFDITKKHWEKVMNRVEELPVEDRQKTSYYAEGKEKYNWEEIPHRISSPYVPAILRYLITTQ